MYLPILCFYLGLGVKVRVRGPPLCLVQSGGGVLGLGSGHPGGPVLVGMVLVVLKVIKLFIYIAWRQPRHESLAWCEMIPSRSQSSLWPKVSVTLVWNCCKNRCKNNFSNINSNKIPTSLHRWRDQAKAHYFAYSICMHVVVCSQCSDILINSSTQTHRAPP